METRHTRAERLAAWMRRHKLPIIISSAVPLLAAAITVFFTLILPSIQSSDPEDDLASDQLPPPPTQKHYSKLSGLEIESEDLNNSPVTCIMIENSPSSRPHSGLTESPIVYEAISEGGITRFLTIWQNPTTALIGPVRSLRLYYLEWATPYNCSIAHVGGSAEALSIVRDKNNGYRDIDQFFHESSYWRATDRYAPHNVYTSSTLIKTLNEKRGYATSDPATFPRTESSTPSPAPTATTINLRISSVSYNPTYTYDATTNSYLRSYQNGQPHMSTTTCADKEKPVVKDCEQTQLSPSVVVAMIVRESDSAAEPGRESITTTGTGKAYVFQNGDLTEATWSRSNIRDQITFRTTDGDPIIFNPGQIWISAIPSYRSDPVTWQ